LNGCERSLTVAVESLKPIDQLAQSSKFGVIYNDNDITALTLDQYRFAPCQVDHLSKPVLAR
jgi:hypothetical protein